MRAFSRRELLASSVGAAGMMGGLSACSDSAINRPFYSSDHHPSDYPTVTAVRYLGQRLSELTGGRLGTKVFPGGQLGSERDTLELTVFGGLDMTRVNAAPLNSIAPQTIVPCLPFLFRDEAHMRSALDSAPGEQILSSLKDYGLVGLCFYDSGARSFYNTKGPLRTPNDFKGMKIRVQNSDLYVSMIAALGADATPMYLGEVYQSLVQGVIDGAENNWPSYYTGRHFEVAKSYSLTRHVMAPEVLVMSKHRWDRLNAQDKDFVFQAARESVPVMRKAWDERVDIARKAVTDAGVKVNEVDDITAFSEAMRPVWDKFLNTAEQKKLVEDIQSIGAPS